MEAVQKRLTSDIKNGLTVATQTMLFGWHEVQMPFFTKADTMTSST